jgi:hypothetical protein
VAPLPSLAPQGRPKSGPEDKFRLTPVAPRLQQLLGKPVGGWGDARLVVGPGGSAARARSRLLPLLASPAVRARLLASILPLPHQSPPFRRRRTQVKKLNDCIGEEVAKAVASAKNGELLLLENVRFYKEEEKNEPEFAKKVRLHFLCIALVSSYLA